MGNTTLVNTIHTSYTATGMLNLNAGVTGVNITCNPVKTHDTTAVIISG
jgi:hypothetical protein